MGELVNSFDLAIFNIKFAILISMLSFIRNEGGCRDINLIGEEVRLEVSDFRNGVLHIGTWIVHHPNEYELVATACD